MTLIDLKPVKRCGECNHLIPANMDYCPYCHDEVKPTSDFETPEEEVQFERKPMSPETKKRLMMGGCGLLVIIVGALLWQFIANSLVLNKSILEPLDESVVRSQAEDNPDFYRFYQEVSQLREFIKSDEDKEKYGEISYKDFLSYYNSYSSSVYCDEIKKESEDEYEKTMMTPMKARIDSVKSYWSQYVESHDISKLINVEIKKDYLMGGYPAFWFIVKYPKDKLSNCSSDIEFRDYWGYPQTYPQSLSDLLTHNSKDQALHLNWQDSNYWRNHDISLTIHSVTIEKTGETINEGDINKVPVTVRIYLDNATESNEYSLIKETIDENFPSKEMFAHDAIVNNLKEKNELIYGLIERVENSNGYPIIQRGF